MVRRSETPEPVAEFPWELINPKYKWFARDDSGDAYLYESRPFVRDGHHMWLAEWGESVNIDVFAVYAPTGTTHWRNSLQHRPTEI